MDSCNRGARGRAKRYFLNPPLFVPVFFIFFSPPFLAAGQAEPLSWDFRKEGAAREWKISGADFVKRAPEGLKISGDDFIRLLAPQAHPVDAGKYQLLEVRAKASKILARLGVTWARGGKSAPHREIIRVLENTGRMQTLRINLGYYPEWSGRVSEFLLGFYSRGGRIVVESVKIRPASFPGTLRFAWDEFFQPEYFKPLSINAIHGPSLFGRKWISWNYLFILMLLLSGSVFLKKRKSAPPCPGRFRGILLLILLFWVAYDLRFSYDMGRSLRNVYARAFSSPGEKPGAYILGDFFEFARFCDQKLPPAAPVNYFAESEAFFPRFKYFAAPRKAFYAGESADYFVSFHDPALSVAKGKLVYRSGAGAGVLAERGRVMGRFSHDSFIYKAAR